MNFEDIAETALVAFVTGCLFAIWFYVRLSS